MSLPLSDIVDVSIAVSPTLDPLAGFGEMLFLTNDPKDLEVLPFAERQRKFGSLSEVQDAWKAYPSSEVVVAATSFYSQVPQPKDFTAGVMIRGAIAGAAVGGLAETLEVLKAENAAEFKITIDGTEVLVSNLSLADATSMQDVADKVSAVLGNEAAGAGDSSRKLRAIVPLGKCTYSGGRFTISSLTTGQVSTVSTITDTNPSTSTLGEKMALTDATVLSVAAGRSAGESVAEALGECDNISDSFVAVLQHRDLRDKEESVSGVNGAAAWCQANNKIFLNTTNDKKVMGVAAEQQTTEAFKIKQKSFGKTLSTYGRDPAEYPSASLFGRIATVNYEGTNTCITLKFKKLPGITALNLTKAQKKALDKVNVGGFMSYGGNLMYAESRMADNGWMDTVHGLMWLEDRVKKGVFNLMYGTTTKVPYTDVGIDMVVQKVTTALEQGVANGLIAAGKTPEGEFLPTGYKIIAKSSTEVAAEDKSNRIYRGITFVAVGAGALHGVVITGSFSE